MSVAEMADHTELLLDLATQLGGAVTTQQVGDVVAAFSTERLGTAYASVLLLDEAPGLVRYLRVQPLPDEVTTLMARIPPNSPSATTDALIRRAPVLHGTLDGYLSEYPHLREATMALGVRSLAHLPMVSGDRNLGIISLTWVDEQEFGPEDHGFLATVAGECALAIQRAELFEQKSELATVLQRAILPRDLPESDRVRLSARYLPAEASVEVGGDWYDAFYGPDDQLWLSVGDVGGHGVEAASVMGQLRNAVRAGAFADLGPARALDVVDRLLDRLHDVDVDTVLATAVVATIDPHSGTMAWSSAGHLPPVLMRAGGAAELMEEHHGPLLGVAHPGRVTGELHLDPGDVVVLYTDGLVENRGESLDDGLARLLAALGREPAGNPSVVADRALASSLAGTERRDDLCILAVQLTGAP